ncbi:SRPBCC family protein [Shimia sediminis]|uniref:SRPBCC family protein n=1 Tax=Shimia sediminis TaxID=2497945 RepID=UPI0013E0499D|nr:SRPBCC domain-containing protein [Shimia sediminis]
MKIRKSYKIPAPVATVYAAWVSSQTVIPPAIRMNVEPRVGGRYQLFMTPENNTADCEGTFSEVRPEQRLRYSWRWNGADEETWIMVCFHPDGEDTRLDILHEGFTSQESLTNHDLGWDSYVSGLSAIL